MKVLILFILVSLLSACASKKSVLVDDCEDIQGTTQKFCKLVSE